MQSTLELIKALFASITAAYNIKADDEVDGNDLVFVLPLIFKWQEGIKDLNFAIEASRATPEGIDAMFDIAAKEELGTIIPEKIRYAIKNMAKGYYVTYWVTAGHTAEAMVRELKKHGEGAFIAKYSAA